MSSTIKPAKVKVIADNHTHNGQTVAPGTVIEVHPDDVPVLINAKIIATSLEQEG